MAKPKAIEMIKESVVETVRDIQDMVMQNKKVKLKEEYGINTTIYLNGSFVFVDGVATVSEKDADMLREAGVIE